MTGIIKRIIANIGVPDILSVLGSIPLTQLQSLLLEVYRKKTEGLEVSKVVHQAEKNRFVSTAKINQRDVIAFDHLAYGVLPEIFEAVELSPVAPLGTNRVLGNTNQNNVVTTIRNTEVVADPTSSLSLLCAQKRRALLRKNHTSAERVSFATSHRILRGQSFEDIGGFTPHFRAFALATAGRDVGFEKFEKEVIVDHISFYLSLLDELAGTEKFHVRDVTVSLSDIRIIEHLASKLGMDRLAIGRNTQNPSYSPFGEYGVLLPSMISSLEALPVEATRDYGLSNPVTMLKIAEKSIVQELKIRFPHVTFDFDIERTAGMGYYSTLCFKIAATNVMGHKFPLVDGGMSDWTQKIVSSKKERYLSSGIGSELFCNLFTQN